MRVHLDRVEGKSTASSGVIQLTHLFRKSPFLFIFFAVLFHAIVFLNIYRIVFLKHLWLPMILDIPSNYVFYLSILAIMKNEAPYVSEWIEYHLLVGVQKFWLGDNDSQDNLTDVLHPYMALGIVSLVQWPGPIGQVAVYNKYHLVVSSLSYWVAIIDLDEFLVPIGTHSVSVVLRAFEGSPGVTANWVMYGSNGKEKKEDGLVIERFQYHSNWGICENKHTKAIVNPRMVRKMGLHEHDYLYGLLSRSPNGQWNQRRMFDRPPIHEVLRINHYWTKSFEEFRQKKSRGWPGGYHKKANGNLRSHFVTIRDVITNDTVIAWAIPLVKENLAKRQNSSIFSA
jgi:hypothetical protein